MRNKKSPLMVVHEWRYRLPPNLRSTDRALLSGRAIIHLLGIECCREFGNAGIAREFANSAIHSSYDRRHLGHGIHKFIDSINPVCCSGFGDGSFLPASCGRPQAQAVPSSRWDAPCPVVTPSPAGAWLGVICGRMISQELQQNNKKRQGE